MDSIGTGSEESVPDLVGDLPDASAPSSPTEPTSPHLPVEEAKLTQPAQAQASSRNSSQGASSSASHASAPAYDPRALLNPKAAAKRARTHSSQPDGASAEQLTDEGTGMGSMIERMHGVQYREDQPVKKQRRDPVADQADTKATFEGAGKNTVLGEYVNEQKKLGEREAGPLPASSSVVDLTAGMLRLFDCGIHKQLIVW